MIRFLAAASTIIFAGAAHAHDQETPAPASALGLEETLAAFNLNIDEAEIRTEKIADGLYVLFGFGGNIAVSAGDDGVLIVDDQIPQLASKIKNAISAFSDGEIDVIVNTHWHFDHAEGNLAFGKDPVQIVAQKNSREMMLRENIINLVSFRYKQQAYEPHGLPNVTYEKAMSFYFNDEEVALYHFGPAHTTGDTAVYFKEKNALHMGDVFNNSGFPFIDAGNGGGIDGVISFCEDVLAKINEDTIIIPGHGPVTDYAEMARYIEILKKTRAKIKKMIGKGKTLDEILAARPTKKFEEEFGADDNNVKTYVDRVYHSLTR